MKSLKLKLRKHPYFCLLLLVVIALIVWEFLGRHDLIKTNDWSYPSRIFTALGNDMFYVHVVHGDNNTYKPLYKHFFLTLGRWGLSFILATLIGIVSGFALGISRTGHALGYHVVNFLRGLPSAIVWPICALIIGYEIKSQLIVIIFGSMWPILINTTNAIRSVPQEIYDTFSFVRLDLMRRWCVLLICASPGILTGVEISCAISFLLAITVEIFYPSLGGLGWYLVYHAESREQSQVFAAVFLASLTGWGLNTFIHWVRKRVIFWEDEISNRYVIKTLKMNKKLIEKVEDKRLRKVLITDTVTEEIENAFKIQVIPTILYPNDKPYMFPKELSKLGAYKEIIQRDIKIDVPINKTGKSSTILFARSWISIDELDEQFKKHLIESKLTIGKIIQVMGIPCDYQNIGYQSVISEKLNIVFGIQGAIELIQRLRVISIKGKPAILIHEFVPV